MMRNTLILSLFFAFLSITPSSAKWNIKANEKYHLVCNQYAGFLGLGAYQGASAYLYYQTNSTTPTSDGYWYVIESGNGYAIQNALTGQYLSWTSEREDKTYKYLTLTDAVSSDNERWQFVDGDSYISIQSLAQPTYYFNLRTDNTYLLGTYQSAGTSANEQFRIVDSEGNDITANDDSDDLPFSAGKRYTLQNAKGYGYLIYNPDQSAEYPWLGGYTTGSNGCKYSSYQESVDVTHANNQWVINHDDNGYYLYSLGAGKYISNSNNTNPFATSSTFYFTDSAEPFSLTEYSSGVYALRLTEFEEKEYLYLCAASQLTPPISSWSIDDDGSQWLIAEATTTIITDSDSGNTDATETTGYDTTVEWDGKDDTHTFPNWTSNNAGKSSTSSHYYVKTDAEGQFTISFNWSVSSEGNYDFFYATLDGTDLVSKTSGINSGTFEQTFTLSSGTTHQLTFTYEKDYGTNKNNDCAMVKNLTFTREISVERITLSAESETLEIGQSTQLTATVSPDNAVDRSVTWSSNNTDVATVSSTGKVTAVSTGTAVITATANDGSGVRGMLTLTVKDPYLAHSDEMFYLRQSDSTMVVIPQDYITEYTYNGSRFTATLTDGEPLVLKGIIDVSEETPADQPAFTVYKFNNKFNDQLFTDAESTEPGASTINLSVACIGKWLTASFQLNDEHTKVYVNGVRQRSKKTRQSFANPVTYQLTNADWQQLQLKQEEDGSFSRSYTDYTRNVTVNVDFLTDHSKAEYKVPRINITFGTGTTWNSNSWIGQNGKSTYVDGYIAIDGGGVYPDMDPTAIQIKGRGNTSWSSSYRSKNPYHFKFSQKTKPLGMTKGKHWILLANKQTGSMTTNAIGMKVANQFGVAAANHIIPVELYINGSYRGSYNLTERLGFSNNSIDLDDETSAALIELDTYTDETIYKTNAYSLPAKIHEPDIDEEGVTLTADEIITDFNNMVAAVYAQDGSYLNYMDADYATRYLMANEYIANCELKHPKSVFLYSENVTDGFDLNDSDATPWILGPLWDCDWAFGYQNNYTYYQVSSTDDYFGSLISGGDSSGKAQQFWKAIRYGSEAVDMNYYYLWYDFIHKGGLDELVDYCDEYYDFAKASFTHNSSNESSEKDGSDYSTITANSKTWLTNRAQYILSTLNTYELEAEDEDDDNYENNHADHMGDVNDDGAISTADVVCVLNSMVNLPNETYYAARADLDSNGKVSIGDLVALCNLVMEQPAQAKRQLHLPAATATLRICSASAEAQSEVLVPVCMNVDEGDYSALQMDIRLPEGVELNGVKLPAELADMELRTQLLSDGTYRMMLYADGSHRLPETETTLQLQLITGDAMQGYIYLNDVTLSTTQGEEERLPNRSCTLRVAADNATGIADVTRRGNDEKVVYDLSGRRVNVVRHGVYIINGKKVIK